MKTALGVRQISSGTAHLNRHVATERVLWLERDCAADHPVNSVHPVLNSCQTVFSPCAPPSRLLNRKSKIINRKFPADLVSQRPNPSFSVIFGFWETTRPPPTCHNPLHEARQLTVRRAALLGERTRPARGFPRAPSASVPLVLSVHVVHVRPHRPCSSVFVPFVPLVPSIYVRQSQSK